MKTARLLFVLAALVVVPVLAGSELGSRSMGLAGEGAVDEFGYNYTARIFAGAADGVERVLDGAVWGDLT
jgi:hypothetical protein